MFSNSNDCDDDNVNDNIFEHDNKWCSLVMMTMMMLTAYDW